MANIISSAIPSEELNKYVANKISKHLFIVCNYNPDSLIVYSNDAKFMKAVMNLYKFLIDASFCKSLNKIQRYYNLSVDCKRLDQIITTISAIRTLLGHNEDSKNGSEENKEKVELWFSSIIGKKYPESLDEYEKPIEVISRYGDECVSILQSFVREVAKNKKKNDIVKEWEKLIFDFYKRPNSKNIFKGNLRMSYKARVGISKTFKEVDIAIWVKKMLFYSEQSQIDNLQELKKKNLLSNDVQRKISAKISENKRIIDQRNMEIAKRINKQSPELRLFDYLDYYLTMFPQRIIEENSKGTVESLLPQDVIQKIIDDDFSSIPI